MLFSAFFSSCFTSDNLPVFLKCKIFHLHLQYFCRCNFTFSKNRPLQWFNTTSFRVSCFTSQFICRNFHIMNFIFFIIITNPLIYHRTFIFLGIFCLPSLQLFFDDCIGTAILSQYFLCFHWSSILFWSNYHLL